ncbi:MAG: peptidoglycan-binding protein [Bifidobacteriaceae bacterium]|jgi:hypothetical protein|nr:peptidoglycan-binding protein [Bifidobacteriaceae bacterium]
MIKVGFKARAGALAAIGALFAGVATVGQVTAPLAEAATANVACSTSYNAKGYSTAWGTIKPLVPVTSGISTDCYLIQGAANGAVTALQNGLAFTDYNLRANPPRWEYAGILVGSGALAANNWGIDGKFGSKTYYALRAFQADYLPAGQVDGKFGNDTRQKLWFGANNLVNGYKYMIRGVHKTAGTWYRTTGQDRKVYAYN